MIQIVCKGYKFILKQLNDFFGVVNKIVISLKSTDGRKKYEEVFGRKPPEKGKDIKTRILSVFQTKLTDFSRRTVRIVRKCQNLVCGNLRIIFKEPGQIQQKKHRRNHAISVFQTRLTDFIDGAISVIKRKIRLPYKTRPVPLNEKYISSKLPDSQVRACLKIRYTSTDRFPYYDKTDQKGVLSD
jgi:hypothetical protein